MSGLCHGTSNIEIGVEYQLFVIVIFFNCEQVLQFWAHSRYYKGALTQKRYFLVLGTTFRSDFHVGWKNQNKHSTLNMSFDALSKWHEPHIKVSLYFKHICLGAERFKVVECVASDIWVPWNFRDFFPEVSCLW